MTVLVLGSSGQLATHLRERMPDAAFWGREKIDLGAHPEALLDAIAALRPSLVVNAAAYTAVDKAESEPERAWQLNAAAAAAAARAAAALDVALVHFSTDYVFDGRSPKPYAVDDAARPVNVYGATKLAGEIAVRTLCPKHWILRTSWVFSEHGSNFVKTVLRLARTGNALRIVSDQRGRPTYADDLALAAARLAESPRQLGYGTHHAVGGRATTWHGFAEAIVARAHARGLLEKDVRVTPIVSDEYPTPARRPANSLIEPSAELTGLGVSFDWERGLERVLSRL